ncbi:MAG: DUF928 domain-containing protein [Cyanobacteria bacterium SID2]|nr:DUF928 domain-containing protein [Cyanobacteria bacterium SID2]MBP0005713.1 DUF928 domain-containing protein [Cyanobacteria bacterium SBC]
MISLGFIASIALIAGASQLVTFETPSTTPSDLKSTEEETNALETGGLRFTPRDLEPTEGETGGTGARGTLRSGDSCVVPDENIVLLAPPQSPLATAMFPGFLAVLPPRSRPVDRGELRIMDDEGTLYRARFLLPDNPGVVQLPMSEIPELEPGVPYEWSVMILCDESDYGQNPIGVGYFYLAEPTPEVRATLGDETCSEQIDLCANDGIWYDPVAGLFEARLANPDDETLAADWQSLLESVDLGDYASKPLVGSLELEE